MSKSKVKKSKVKKFIVKRISGSSVAADLFEKAMAQDGHIVLGPNQEAITLEDGTAAIVDWSQLFASPVNVTITLGKPNPKKETES